ncbi:ATP-binding protein [Paenalcaligenes sp. Me52]|uniref:ATP-binding protein n=1 Tax=Paenalcaligenes sp. Me52 TaxID=3392038 RepID=UPI003D266FC4
MDQLKSNSSPLTLRFAHNVIEHLGLKLYQNKPTNVLAELVSNSWDAMASNVFIDLSVSEQETPIAISIYDNGQGMSKEGLIKNYLVVGQPKPRPNTANNEHSDRYPMGRKGIGKLAPFGIAQIVHLITVHEGTAMWLKFDYTAMLASEQQDASTTAVYAPEVLADEISINDLVIEKNSTMNGIFQKFKDAILTSGSGTLIYSTSLTIKKQISIKKLRESLGRRFTVTLARPDFNVHVNGDILTEADVFPEWELRIPEQGMSEHVLNTPVGNRLVKFWVGFVKSASWPHEEAGVGVYAHGKIAQDRPFFFGVKGREIFSRYMYAVVEADWIDELKQDTISTDRTSVNWEDADLESLHTWGAQSVAAWKDSLVRSPKFFTRICHSLSAKVS